MALQQPFSTSAPAIASYDFTDIADLTGYVTFFSIDTENDETKLSRLAVDSSQGRTSVSFDGAEGADALRAELDFDVSFQLPQRLKGQLFVTLTHESANGGGNNTVSYVKVQIIHYDGSTETTIGTQQTGDNLSFTGTGDIDVRKTFNFDVDKHFKSDETLRINIELWGSGGNSSTVRLYHDGGNRDNWTLAENSNMITQAPFRIEL